MTIVRIKVDDKKSKLTFFVIAIIILLILLAVLVFNPINNINTYIAAKKQNSLNKTPTYEALKTTNIVGDIKYSLPVRGVVLAVVEGNSVKVIAEKGTTVKSVDDGIISDIGTNNVYGNYIEVSHCKLYEDEIYLFYGNLGSRINGDVVVIQEGQKLGEIGDNGYMYFEIRDQNHKSVSPYKYMNLNDNY